MPEIETTRRVTGHALANEGAPHNANGLRVWKAYGSTAGEGHGKCSCGTISPLFLSAAERNRWHRQHKALVANTPTHPQSKPEAATTTEESA